MNLNLVATAITKAKMAIAEKLGVGRHVVKGLLVRIDGTVDVSEDYERTPTASIPLIPALALFKEYSGVTGPHALKALVRAMTDAVYANGKGETFLKNVAEIEETMKEVKATFESALPKVVVNGPQRCKLTATIIDNDENE